VILHLVGDGPEKGKIQERIVKDQLTNVHMNGWLGPEELSLRYAQAHVFIHPSRKEGFGKVLLEAMSYGLPIIGADVGISRELVEKNCCGILFHSGDANHLANRINDLLLSDVQRLLFGENGRKISRTLVLESLEQRYRQFVREEMYLA
jgi:glycosyltransferase involved in cell wall biosynthesis